MSTIPSPSRIKLGMTIKDLTTGLTGIATSRHVVASGNIQFAIQPPIPFGQTAVPDAHHIDHHLLEVVDAGISARAQEPDYKGAIQIGDRVRDLLSGLEGVVSSQTTFLNGCVYFVVQPETKKTDKGELPAGHFIDATRLELIDSKVRAKLAPKHERPPGGPRTKAMRPT